MDSCKPVLSKDTMATNFRPDGQNANERSELVDFCAFVSHPSKSLKDSMILWAAANNTRVQSTAFEDELLMLEQRSLQAFSGKSATEVLIGFCQGIPLLYQTRRDAMAVVCGITQQLFIAFDGKLGFAREQLPLGLQGLQQVDWAKQNEDMAALRQRHREKRKDKAAFQANLLTMFCKDGPKENEYLCTGAGEMDMVYIDQAMKAADLIKYRIHTFDDGEIRESRCSWHAFVKTDHPGFVRGSLQHSSCPTQDLGLLLMLAIKLFSKARAFVENPLERDEMVVLKETIWRTEFFEKSTVIIEDEESTAEADPPTPSDQNLPPTKYNDSAAPGDQKRDKGPHSRSSSRTSSSSSAFVSETMDAPQVDDVTAHLKAQTTKKAKKQKKAKDKAQRKRARQENVQLSAQQDTSGKAASLPDTSIIPPIPNALPTVQSKAETNKNTSTRSNQDDLSQNMTGLNLSAPPFIPSTSIALPYAQPQSRSKKVKQRSNKKEGPGDEGNMETSSVSKTFSMRSTPPITPAMPGHRQQTLGRKPAKRAATPASGSHSQKENGEPSSTTDPAEASQADGEFPGNWAQFRSTSRRVAHTLTNSIVAIPLSSGLRKDKPTENELESQEKGKEVLKDPKSHNAVEYKLEIPTATPKPFKFDSLHPELKCRQPDCRAMTSCWDHAVVICPACGTDSLIRYCKAQHLYDDIQRHWIYECGRTRVVGLIDRSTIRAYQMPMRPYLRPAGRLPNILERHRQAVYRAMESGDYFIFADLGKIDPSIAEPTPAQWTAVRGSGELACQLNFVDNGRWECEAQQFNYHIQRMLTLGKPMAENSCLTALAMIRNKLITMGSWSEEMLTYLCMQLAGEWGGFKVPEAFYNVVEVNAMWAIHRVTPVVPLA